MDNSHRIPPVNVSQCCDAVRKLIDKSGVKLRDHQLEGLDFMIDCYKNGHGCIVADEMGLGKTCQSVAMLNYFYANLNGCQFLVICPLSVFEHWTKEINRFGCGQLKCIPYRGEKEVRPEIRNNMNNSTDWNVVLTTYELFLKDLDFFCSFTWTCVVIDEGHRLKNPESQIFAAVRSLKCKWALLLTGTPVQNNLEELYSLLHVVAPRIFSMSKKDEFLVNYSDPKNSKAMKALRTELKKYILRRTKDIIAAEIPEKSEVLLYHGITSLQKRLYKAILTKNYDVFDENAGKENAGKQRLLNTLMQLRKCVNHPYLFEGVEPEPFEEGEHIVESSGKLMILDCLLRFLKKNNHKVLVFSQMTKTLDILQDYLSFRGFTYERLDGSVRGEERFAAVNKFNENSATFVFLLSTKAGGVGLTLTGADTVIFVDSDFNPQNDVQAAARAHRIGQEKPVKIIRLVAKHTVEEIVLARAEQKLKLTNAVIEGSDKEEHQMTAAEITEMLTFGLKKMNSETEAEKSKSEQELVQILGDSVDGIWKTVKAEPEKVDKLAKNGAIKSGELDETERAEPGSMYVFEGKDYKEEAKLADREALNALIDSAKKELEATSLDGAGRRRSKPATLQAGLPEPKRAVRILTAEEVEARKRKREEAATKKKQKKEEEEMRKQREARDRQKKFWKSNDYTSTNLPELVSEEDDGDLVDVDEDSKAVDPIFVSGDVAHPEPRKEDEYKDAVIVHCVDNSGSWPRGGVFGAISNRSVQPEQHYKLAKKMGDLAFGDAHLVEADELESRGKARDFIALVVAQDKRYRDELKMGALKTGLQRIGAYALKNECTVHLPRIGYGLAKFNWYGIERLIKKILCRSGIPTYVYYYPRGKPAPVLKRKPAEEEDKGDDSPGPGTSREKRKKLASVYQGMTFYLCGIKAERKKELGRLIMAFDGDVTENIRNPEMSHVVVGKEELEKEELTEVEAVESTGDVVAVKLDWLDRSLKIMDLLKIDEDSLYKF